MTLNLNTNNKDNDDSSRIDDNTNKTEYQKIIRYVLTSIVCVCVCPFFVYVCIVLRLDSCSFSHIQCCFSCLRSLWLWRSDLFLLFHFISILFFILFGFSLTFSCCCCFSLFSPFYCQFLFFLPLFVFRSVFFLFLLSFFPFFHC